MERTFCEMGKVKYLSKGMEGAIQHKSGAEETLLKKGCSCGRATLHAEK